MCYTIVTHFNRCSHRTSTINLCPRSTHHLPTIYHPPRPCVTNSHEYNFFVCHDQLCDACLGVNSWFGGGDWPNKGTGRDEPGIRMNKKQDKSPSRRVTEAHPSYHHHSSSGQRISVWRQGIEAELLDPIPTHAAQEDRCRCSLSEAFEHAMRIEGDGGGPASADDWFQEEEEEWSGEVGEGDGVYNVRTMEREGEYGPLRPPHFPSHDSGKRFAGSPSLLGGHGGYSGGTRRRTGGNKKRVRFARKAEMVRFRGDSATRTLGSLGREYKACR